MSISKNVCQYWVEDPVQCSNWDNTAQTCKYNATPGDTPTKYPKCNSIGTNSECSHYTGTGTAFRCILPDVSRQVGQRAIPGGDKWTIEEITKYNSGACDSAGTAADCSAYSPHHMGFSSIQPDSPPYSADTEGFSTATSGLEYRLPLYYDIAYARAQLSRCRWWNDEASSFVIDSATGKVGDILNKCNNTSDEKIQAYWTKHTYDKDLGMWQAPCNGCKPECPGYTGVCWEYCVDSKMRQGDKVLAEQILELRYYLYKENWDPDKYKNSFANPEIQAWAGKLYQTTSIEHPYAITWLIDAWHVYFSDFEHFHTNREKVALTAGTQSNNYDGQYPDLVKEIKSLPLKPIIRNKFERLELPNGEQNVFESCDMHHDEIVILGDSFWYNSNVYAINLSDPALSFLPKAELLEYNSMFEMEQAWADTVGKFDQFYAKLSKNLDFILKAMPDKMPVSEINNSGMFYIGAHTFWGNNDIVVFDNGSGAWEYDRINFTKLFVSGVIGQTSFSLKGEGTVDYLPSYQDDFMAGNNNNGTITFSFFPLASSWFGEAAQLSYIYNDAVRLRLPANPSAISDTNTYISCYKLYKIKFATELELTIPNGELRVLGNSGYMLVTITDSEKSLSNAIKPWEIDGKVYLHYGNEQIEMVVHEKGTDRLEVNQFIIRPKTLSQFKQVCNDTYLTIDNIYLYEKHSFGQLPALEYFGYEVIHDTYVGEDDALIYRDDIASLTGTAGSFTMTKFGYDTLVISAIIKGLTGRIRGQVKTKMITWVRQPYCRDVEIYYKWAASYERYTLLPEYECYGRPDKRYHLDENGTRLSITTSYIPPCGDHDLSSFTETGPMWYPYSACDEYARYNIVSNLTEWDISVMDPFLADADPPHGQWDIRMMGPANHFGKTGDSHATLRACLCDWSFYNDDKVGPNRFVGYARYRGGLDYLAKEKALKNSGSLPKFGNVYRDFLRSYRSIDNIDYYTYEESTYQYTRKHKWVPANEFFTTLDLSVKTADYLYNTYSSSDYYDDGSFFINPLGLYVANTAIENIFINEQMHVGPDGPYRFRFEEVFDTHNSTAGIYYPFPRTPSFRMINGVPVPIIPWYTYKDFPIGGFSESIQWAWQEMWKDIERGNIVEDAQFPYEYVGEHLILTDSSLIDGYIDSNYVDNNGILKGQHLFLNVVYPDYKYDYEKAEHRLVCDEGDHTITISPPRSSEPGVFETDYWTIKLNDGSQRYFNASGDWVDGEGDTKVLYDTCTQSPWVTDITLFDTGYNSTDPNDDRTITDYDELGDEIKTYYQRGLDISIDASRLNLIPSSAVLLSFDKYEVKFANYPNCTDEDNPYSAVEVGEWIPNLNGGCYSIGYCENSIGNDIVVNVDFRFITNSGTEQNRCISAVAIDFQYGSLRQESIDGIEGGLDFIGYLYHLPGVTIYKSDNGVIWTETRNVDSMYLTSPSDTLNTKTALYDIDASPLEYVEGYKYLRLAFRISPTENEVATYNVSKYFNVAGVVNIIGINCIRLYFGDLLEAVEEIKTYERLYNISYGTHGDIAPHGNSSTGSLLYYTPSDRSTVYQFDSVSGMVGMPNSAGVVNSMNKVRGRLMKECHADKEFVTGTDIHKWEEEQKKIHDEIAVKTGSTSFTLKSFTHPSLESDLNDMNMSFPSWECSFENSIVRPLSPITPRSSYSPCGHSFDHDYSNLYRDYACAKFGSVFGRWIEDVFDYSFVDACTGKGGTGTIDAITAYTHGVGALLTNPFLFTMSNAYIRAVIGDVGGYASTQGGDVKLAFPANVPNLY